MYRVDLEQKCVIPLEEITFTDMGARERFDIQEWIDKVPGILEGDEDSLLILSKEYSVNQDAARGIRSDLLAIDRNGTLVVIEIKRDEARGDVDWQAIKYAARYSRYSPADIVRMFSSYRKCGETQARQEIVEHINGDYDGQRDIGDDAIGDLINRTPKGYFDVRIILVARNFHREVASAALWLLDSGVSVSCVELRPYKDTKSNEIFIVSEKIIPLPTQDDYIAVETAKKYGSREIDSNETSHRVNRRNWASDIPAYSDERLGDLFKVTLSRESPLTPRLRLFLETLANQEEPGIVKREVMKQVFVDKKIAGDIGLAGRYLSNISQFINKKDNGHLRQVIEFQRDGSSEEVGAIKDDYRILDQYRELMKRVLNPEQ